MRNERRQTTTISTRKEMYADDATFLAEATGLLADIMRMPDADFRFALIMSAMKSKAVLPPDPTCQRKSGPYRVNTQDTELPEGALFTVSQDAVRAGDLALFDIGGALTVGRWVPDVEGCDWILQAGKCIQMTGSIPVRCVGPVEVLQAQPAA